MPAKVRCLSSQQGSAILMTLMVLLVLSVLGMGIVGVAGMEFKTSHYDYETQQAQQAADAGVDWGMENIYQVLKQAEYLSMEQLPANLSDEPQWDNRSETSFNTGADTCAVSIGDVIKKPQSSPPHPGTNTCTYEFSSTGTFRGVSKSVTVVVVYTFMGGYNDPDDGNLVARSDFQRGKIKSYKKL